MRRRTVSRIGLGSQWSTTKILRAAGFNVVAGSSYDGLFWMLDHDRFDVFPRGVNEIFQEIEARRDSLPNLMIEPSLALYVPTPYYFFVSPQTPRLSSPEPASWS